MQELLPNRKRVLFDPLRRHAEYDDSLYHIKNLTHKYYKQNNDFDILGDEKLRKTIAAYQKQPVNPRLVRGLFNLNKKSKTTALIEGYKTFKILRTSKPAARFKRSFPVIVSAWRALKQQFSVCFFLFNLFYLLLFIIFIFYFVKFYFIIYLLICLFIYLFYFIILFNF